MKKVLAIILSIILILMSAASSFAAADDLDVKIDGILNYRLKAENVKSLQQLVTSVFSSSPASNEDWYIFALRNYRDDINYQKYRSSLEEYVSNNTISNVTTRQRAALVLLCLGSESDFINTVIDETAGEIGVMSWVFALHLLTNGAQSKNHSADSVVNELLKLQLEDGGWAVMGNSGDIDITSMVIQALAPYSVKNDVGFAVKRGLELLSQRQQDDGGFISFGVKNPESAAQVLLALSCMGIDGLKDEDFIKNGHTILDSIESFRLSDGSYSHSKDSEANKNSTSQVLYSLVGYKMCLENKGSFYVFDEFSEPELFNELEFSEENQTDESAAGSTISLKTILLIAIAAAVIICLAVCLIKGKKNIKSYISILIAGAVLAAAVLFINLESTGSFYGGNKRSGDDYITTTLTINCECIAGEKDFIPENGKILDFASIVTPSGSTAYDQLITAAKEYKIHTDVQSGYVRGISNIYEFDFGDLSGWLFKINGEFANKSFKEYVLNDNDYIEWVYTLDLGKDAGNTFEETK